MCLVCGLAGVHWMGCFFGIGCCRSWRDPGIQDTLWREYPHVGCPDSCGRAPFMVCDPQQCQGVVCMMGGLRQVDTPYGSSPISVQSPLLVRLDNKGRLGQVRSGWFGLD